MVMYKTWSYSNVQWNCVMPLSLKNMMRRWWIINKWILIFFTNMIKSLISQILLGSQPERRPFSNIGVQITQGNRMNTKVVKGTSIKFLTQQNYSSGRRATSWGSQRRSYTTEAYKTNLPKLDNKLHDEIIDSIHHNKWPMKNARFNIEIKSYIKSLQRDIAQIVTKEGKISLNLRKELKNIVTSLPVRIFAIDQLLKNPGSKTPGVDNMGINKENFNSIAFLMLNGITYINLKNYKSDPIKRVNIKQIKSDGSIKIRPLGIPTLKDRIVQKLFTIVLDPAIDAISDPNSYGFRQNRSCHNAIGKIARILQINPHNRIILDYDIKGFFDNICHNWIIEHFPMPIGFEHVLVSWLKAKIMNDRIFTVNDYGVPQGGIISPLIANFVLNGLETYYTKNCRKSTQIKSKIIDSCPSNLEVTQKTFEIQYNLVRYADDFVVITNHNKFIDQIDSNIKTFLNERGLIINKDKSKTIDFSINGASFHFLGYTFSRFDKIKISSTTNRRDLKDNKVLIRPERSKVLNFKHKLKSTINECKNNTAIELISKLNPILRGWGSYYGLGQSAKILAHIDNYVYRRITNWLKRQFRGVSTVKLNQTYFITQDTQIKTKYNPKDVNVVLPISPYGRSWHFHAKNLQSKRTNIKFLVFIALMHKRVPSFIYGINPELAKTTPYINEEAYKNFTVKASLKRIRPTFNDFEKLYKLQEGHCEWCRDLIELNNEGEPLEIHHIKPIKIGGSHSEMSNKTLIHKDCHKWVHSHYGSGKTTIMRYPRKDRK